MAEMKKIHFSSQELDLVAGYWKCYIQLKTCEFLTPDDRQILEYEKQEIFNGFSEETQQVILKMLDEFELQGTQFECLPAPDDVSQYQ